VQFFLIPLFFANSQWIYLNLIFSGDDEGGGQNKRATLHSFGLAKAAENILFWLFTGKKYRRQKLIIIITNFTSAMRIQEGRFSHVLGSYPQRHM
jgi:hypothetical protein